MVPDTPIVYLTREEFCRIPTGDLAPGVMYIVREVLAPPPEVKVTAVKPWVKWNQHPKGPTKNLMQARR